MINKILGYPLMALALTACVTINIYFPAAAAEEAARTIVRDVLKSEQSEPAPPPTKEGDRQSQRTRPNPLLVAFGVVLEQLIPQAQAAQADIDINTPAIRAIRSSMQSRQASLAPFYNSGAIGFDSNGSVAVRDLAAAPLKDRNRLKKLVADENADRSRLYGEIARANGHPEWEADVRATFAKVWAQEALPGYWYQAGGSWRQR
ncbi:MAG: YdbL family protein [Gammaproteobacteria bacterium]|nr:YdbL family protein [Gammaproteobacteria bacterium]